MTRAAIYVRISDPKGDKADRFGLAVQERACREYAERMGLGITQVYTDTITGVSESRVGFGQLLADADAYTDVIVYAVDRLARHPKAGYALLETLQASGLTVHTAIEGLLDLEDDAGALNFGVRIVMADAERRRIVRRLMEGKRQKVKSGVPLAPLRAYGYQKGEVYEPEAQWVRWMFEQALHLGTKEIRNALQGMGILTRSGKSWDRSAILNLLRNSIYRGEYVYGRDRVTRRALPDAVSAPCPRIVSDELWYAVQRAIDYRANGAGKRGSRTDVFPLTGRIRCGVCGAAMVGVISRRSQQAPRYYYYNCGDRHLNPHTRKGCPHRSFYPVQEINEAVWAALRGLADQAASLPVVAPQPQLLDTTRAIADIERQMEKARNAYLRGIDSEDEYAEIKARLTAQRTRLRELAESGTAPPIVDEAHARAVLADALRLGELHEVAARVGLLVQVAPGGALTLQLDPA